MKAYLKAGADIVKSQPKSIEQLKKEIIEVNAPMHIGLGIGPLLNVSVDDLREWGLEMGIVSFPLALLFASVKTFIEILEVIESEKSIKSLTNRLISFNDFLKIVDFDKYLALEERYEKES